MKRYRLLQGTLREHPDGEWLRFEDVKAAVDSQTLETEIAELCGGVLRFRQWRRNLALTRADDLGETQWMR